MRRISLIFLVALILGSTLPAVAAGPFTLRFPASPEGCDPNAVTVVGSVQPYRIKKGDDLLELARDYGLGYSELGVMYRQWDPFILPVGLEMTSPTMWIVPNNHGNQIIVNTGALRLYY